MNAGGTEQDLVAVIAGSQEPAQGAWVLFGLRFADGVSYSGCGRSPTRSACGWR